LLLLLLLLLLLIMIIVQWCNEAFLRQANMIAIQSACMKK
jgi:hypothetical protein